MIFHKQGDELTYELTLRDRHTLGKQLCEGSQRAMIWHRTRRQFIGTIEFSTMQFEPFDRAAAGVEAIEIEEGTEAFLSDN